MKIFWAENGFSTGSGWGYSLHRMKLRNALIAAGADLTFDANYSADIAASVDFPEHFRAVAGRKNILFTNCELSEPKDPDLWRTGEISKADLIVTASQHSAAVIRKHYQGPVEICGLGVDPVFSFHQRSAQAAGEAPRILWLDDANCHEKKVEVVLQAWYNWRIRRRRLDAAELYIKMSGTPNGQIFKNAGAEALGPGAPDAARFLLRMSTNLTIDNRNLPVSEIVALYHSAHIFIKTSASEGFGLSLAESLRTGCPSIWNPWGGVCDYATEDLGFPVRSYDMVPFLRSPGDATAAAEGVQADPSAIIQRWEEILADYPAALEKGQRASERMKAFTWEASARRFLDICENLADARAEKAST